MPGMNVVDRLGLTDFTSSEYATELEQKKITLRDYSSNAMAEIQELASRVHVTAFHPCLCADISVVYRDNSSSKSVWAKNLTRLPKQPNIYLQRRRQKQSRIPSRRRKNLTRKLSQTSLHPSPPRSGFWYVFIVYVFPFLHNPFYVLNRFYVPDARYRRRFIRSLIRFKRSTIKPIGRLSFHYVCFAPQCYTCRLLMIGRVYQRSWCNRESQLFLPRLGGAVYL